MANKKIETKAEAKALMFFLAKEKARHLKDIKKIDCDLLILMTKFNLPIPSPDPDLWVDVA